MRRSNTPIPAATDSALPPPALTLPNKGGGDRTSVGTCLLVAAILALSSFQLAKADDGWRFVQPPSGDPFEQPPLRALVTTSDPPADLFEKVSFRGTRRRYAQIRYGGPNSVRVTVVLDESGAKGADLYVDSDRNRKVDSRDKVEPSGDGRTWRVPLVAASNPGKSGMSGDDPRALVFRLGATGTTFSFAAAGYLEGRVEMAGKSHAARRVDGDANGLLTDPQDRLWVDLDDDGRWDWATEQFFFAPVLTIEGRRYATRSDAIGRRLALAELEGSGTLRLALARPPLAGSVESLWAVVVGRDGSAVSVGGEGDVVIPAGEYRLASTTVIVRDGSGSSWSYTFSDAGRRGPPAWHAVAKDGRAVIDPIGGLELLAGLDPAEIAQPGNLLDLQPRLYNGDGLLIVTVTRSSAKASEQGPTAELAIRQGDSAATSSIRSGFL